MDFTNKTSCPNVGWMNIPRDYNTQLLRLGRFISMVTNLAHPRTWEVLPVALVPPSIVLFAGYVQSFIAMIPVIPRLLFPKMLGPPKIGTPPVDHLPPRGSNSKFDGYVNPQLFLAFSHH